MDIWDFNVAVFKFLYREMRFERNTKKRNRTVEDIIKRKIEDLKIKISNFDRTDGCIFIKNWLIFSLANIFSGIF